LQVVMCALTDHFAKQGGNVQHTGVSKMANLANVEKQSGLSLSILAAPFAAVGRFLVQLAEVSPKMRALEELNRKSDAELEARGLTRDAEMRRILGAAAYV
jgi:hypothetical protein